MKNNYVAAIIHIGDCYKQGKCGLERSLEKAKDCYQKATNLGNVKAKEKLDAIEKESTGYFRKLYNN